MNNEMRKTPVFLIDLSRDKDYTLFLEELGEISSDSPTKRLSGHGFKTGEIMAKNHRHRYLCITLFGGWMLWGGDSELRPLGKFTSEYVPIMGRAITIEHYLEILAAVEKEDDAPKPQKQGYYVEMDSNVGRILAKDRYEGWHFPWFSMKGRTHGVYNICPFEQVYHDAAPTDVEAISAREFVSMYKASYEQCEEMEFFDYKNYLDESQKKGCVMEPELDDTVEELYYKVNEKRPTGIVRIPENARHILPKTFKKCDHITDVILPEGLMTIDRSAFSDCKSLRRIYLPKSIKQIQHGAFHNCTNLVDIYYEAGEKEWYTLCENNISDKSKRNENGIAKYNNNELMKAKVHFDCKM